MLFTAVSGASACCVPPSGDVKFISRPSQKFFSDNTGVPKILYNLLLSAASVVALNKRRGFLFFFNFKTKCINMAIIYVLYDLKLKIWIRAGVPNLWFAYH